MRKPISPADHGLIDYGFGLANTLLPAVFHLKGPARRIPNALAVVQGTLNAFTDQPYAIARVVPFHVHGLMEATGLPMVGAYAVLAGATTSTRGRMYVLGLTAALATVYMLTDWDAKPRR